LTRSYFFKIVLLLGLHYVSRTYSLLLQQTRLYCSESESPGVSMLLKKHFDSPGGATVSNV